MSTTINHFEKPVVKLEFVKDKNKYVWYVTSDFLEQPSFKPDPLIVENILKQDILKFTHNPLGPACVLTKPDGATYESYWLNGLPAKKEEVERLKYNAEFHDHVEKDLEKA